MRIVSYRDPSGFVFEQEGKIYRQVNNIYKTHYDLLHSSGLYAALTAKQLLISHTEIDLPSTSQKDDHYRTLLPLQLAVVSHPHQWSFSALKDAALCTLDVLQTALDHGMILKDAQASNVQLHEGKMIFIDSLSFERYEEDKPWIAYRQFCEQFLAPLALMHYLKAPLSELFLAYPTGIPLSIASRMLPFSSKLHIHTSLHLHLNARIKKERANVAAFTKKKMEMLVRGLRLAVEGYELGASQEWSAYYTEPHLTPEYTSKKKATIDKWVTTISYLKAIDLGANDGTYSKLLAKDGSIVIAADGDHAAIERLYKEHHPFIIPLYMDLSRMADGGWNGLDGQPEAGLVLALALIHHLVISSNLSFEKVADALKHLGEAVIIEFVHEDDGKVIELLARKPIMKHRYTERNFLSGFNALFTLREKESLSPTRTLYLFQRK